MASQVFVDVYTVPPFHTDTGSPDPIKQLWSPTNVTLIHTATTAIVCDCPPTIAETEKLATWIQETIPTKKVAYFFATHAHADHFFGFPVLAKRFPGIEAVATKSVAEGAKHQYDMDIWEKWWGNGRLPSERVVFKALPESNELELDGVGMKAYDVANADCSFNSYLHVPALRLVVACDIVYGDCYQYLVEANTQEKRANWIKALDDIAALDPHIVIPGHARKTQVFGAYLIESTRRYIAVFAEELEKAQSAEDLMARMKQLYPERWNLFLLEGSCAASFANKRK
ncbi:hypothetical protein LTR53_012510 [Teratosphaeriaceae sp. CCFEE 6253]|nr:hypothetical protein LTR53_012510 [Teratosphaeriaceae sp. CCFEE 6253]